MSYEALRLKNQLCFPLYACSREVIKRYKPYLDEIGLTYTQYVVLMVLWEDGQATVKHLGEALHLDSGTLTPLLKRMEKEGLVSRMRDTADERSLVVRLTEKGEQLQEQAADIPVKISGCINLSADEAATLYGLLYKILEE